MPRPSGQWHPAEVTANRLGDALDRWPSQFDGELRAAISVVIFTLGQIAETQPARGEKPHA